MNALETTSRRAFPERRDREAALTVLSLCTMGDAISQGKPDEKWQDPVEMSPSASSADIGNSSRHVAEDNSSRTSDGTGSSFRQRRNSGKPPKKKRLKKPKETKLEKVPFEEMKRLMRIYGPTKCLRNRTSEQLEEGTKILSVKRKFYRWFPDFHERFELQAPGNCYTPKIGHEEEMAYREEMRKLDQDLLTVKRNATKMRKKDPTPQT